MPKAAKSTTKVMPTNVPLEVPGYTAARCARILSYQPIPTIPAMYTISLETEHAAHCDGHQATAGAGGNVALKLANAMLDAGLTDGPFEVIGPNGIKRYWVKSLKAFAGRSKASELAA